MSLTADDYIEIQQLYARYSLALDTGDGDARAATFVPDGVFGRNQESVETIRERTNRKGEDRYLPLGSRHLTFNLVITPTPEGADGVVFLLFLLGPFEDDVVRGRLSVYNDKLVKTPEGWRFKRRDFMDSSASSPFGQILQPVPSA